MPLLGGEKLVIIRGFDFDKEQAKLMLETLKNSSEGTMIVFQAGEVDKRSALYKWIEKKGEAVEFKSFAPWEQAEHERWVRARVHQAEKKISDRAVELLAETVGNNLRLIVSEIEKLVIYSGERGEITAEDVEQLVLPGETSAFELLDSLREKNLKLSLSLFKTLLKNKEDLLSLLSLIAKQYRTMLQIKAGPNAGRDPWQIARAIGGSPYFIKKCAAGINRFSTGELKAALAKLLEANLKLKTGVDQAVTFELLLASLCEG
jgi:DNA polymerase-3 subunit delta